MGLKTTNYNVEDYGITVPQAYARVTDINVNMNGQCRAIFEIQQTREDVGYKKPLNRIHFGCEIDKDQPLYAQIYQKAKEQIFANWEDDIVEPEVETEPEVTETETESGEVE